MKTSNKSKNINNFSIKDIFLDSKEHSIRRVIQDSIEKAKEYKKEEISTSSRTFEEKVCMK